MPYRWIVFYCFFYLMKSTYGGTCPENCASKTCDDPDGGCPKCEKEWWGRQCNNPMGCYWEDAPKKYRGDMSVTSSGRVCQQWSSNSPHKHRFAKLVVGFKNYCRSPGNHPVPWCYTTNRNLRWEACNVPRCESEDLCPVPPFPVHKVLPEGVEFAKPFVPGTSIRVVTSCGTLQRDATIWCQSNRTWASSGGCGELSPYCPRPALERNSYIHEDHNYAYHHNETVDIRCLEGFAIQGPGILECQEDGTWNDTLPTCFMNGSHLCPPMCEDDFSCDNEDRGCPKCKPTRWGRHCEYHVECINTKRGSDYRGLQNRTANGLVCQAWGSQVPQKHPYGTRVDEGASNYCRNPDMEPRPWCYTTNRRTRWQACHVPHCETVCPSLTMPMYSRLTEITNRPFNAGYKLFVEMRCDGRNVSMVTVCQSDLTWSHNVSCDVVHCLRPKLNNNSVILGDDSSRLFAENDTIEVRCPEGFLQEGRQVFQCQTDRSWNGSMPTCNGGICPPMCAAGQPCRDPDGGCPLCKPSWWGRHCQYPMQCYDGQGADYRGTLRMTVSGRKCQSWMSKSPHKHKLNLSDSENFCRNPDKEPKPWCYTVDPNKRWEVCPVPKCDIAALCPPPTLPVYSSVVSPVDSPLYTGSTMLVNLTCGVTHELVSIVCQPNREWTMNRLSCDVVFCATPELRDNSRTIEDTGGPYQQNDTIEVACEVGFETRGQTMFHCQGNSRWNGTMPTCEGVRCTKPNLTANSNIEDAAVSYTYTDVVTVGCDVGYEIVGETYMYCQADGTWNSSLPNCQVVVCRAPSLYDHSFIENESIPYVFGDVIVVKCEEGYQLYGHDTFQCKGDGKWDGSFPVCKGSCPLHCRANQTCSDPDGGCPECEPAWWGRHCQYPLGCRLTAKGLEYRGEMNSTVNGRVCQAWSDTTLHSHRYMKFVDKEANNFCRNPDKEVSPWCYTLDPSVRWEICPVPLCSSLDQCSPPVLPQNITVINPPKIAFFTGSVLLLELQCGEGFNTVATPRIACQDNGTWKQSIPTCQAVRCKHQPLPDHSYITGMFVTHFPYVLTVHIKCEIGYVIEGPSQLTCSKQKYSWNLVRTRCKAVVCPKPVAKAYSYLTPIKNEYPYGSQISVNCIQQYGRIGQGRFQCLSDGRWDGEMPVCKAPTCSVPDVPVTHVVIVHSQTDLSPGGNVTVVCRGSHNGTSIMQCQQNGTFSGSIPKCKGIKCSLPTLTNNSYIDHGNVSFSYGEVIKVLCKKDFTPKSSDQLTCQLDGSWSGQVPECVPVVCNPPDMPPDKYVILNRRDDMNAGGTLQVSCISGKELKGPATLTCLVNGSWSYDNSQCKAVSCSSPDLPDHSVIVRGKKNIYRYRDAILVICSEGYSPLNPVALACQEDKTWNGTMHRCDAVSCQVPTPPDTLQYIIQSSADLQVGGTLSVGCKSGYKTLGNDQMICEADGHWGGHLPDCQAMMCTLPSLSTDLYVVVEQGNGVTPGDVISVWCRPGMRVMGSSYLKCQTDGTWNASSPTCQFINCSPPLEIEYDVIPKKNSYIYKDTVTVQCKDGFELQGTNTLQCGLDGTWGRHQSLCSEVKCSIPSLSKFHVVKMDGSASLSVGGMIYVGCNNETSAGFINLMCTKDKRWNASLPTCDKIKGKAMLAPMTAGADELTDLDTGIIAACVVIFLCTAIAAATYFLIRKFREKSRGKSNIAIDYKDMEDEL
ncbi:sushi, von Willebrand factor type A, EGF and pentraxin domain-containing protein 1-like isoform X1 [Mizuhopecten yessoensis]|uniref:sushi, von Willebrand factor type A, EGF and pentraxin domain-containing protein 1-like isoform X1 n=1 Tax=Mizuhopecten yessoensis TaxID=6573 RepID=UPI000B459AAA|nr:sushi, von Willebrand factor type A, EGF and pentraxin domain-containing protein 1-like isoform X1 [Mizuhopecten yessoensis]